MNHAPVGDSASDIDTSSVLRPTSAEEIQDIVHTYPKLRVQGGNTKPGLTAHRAHAVPLQTQQLSGIVEYDPAEYTITARAGTTLAELAQALGENGQHMPFDPPWRAAGATLGGTIAAGVSGSQRQRYGSLRDFLIGVRFIDGQGRMVRGGGKVVKNAAGFDLPKLMIGSRGEFGILTEASLKVFPAPPVYGSLDIEYPTFAAAATAVGRLSRSSFDLYVLDLQAQPTGHEPRYRITACLGGSADTITPRLEQLRAFAGAGEINADEPTQIEQQMAVGELNWVADDHWLVKCAVTQESATRLEAQICAQNLPWTRHYVNAINSVWLSGRGDLATTHTLLEQAAISGIVLRGQFTTSGSGENAATAPSPVIGCPLETVFHTRVRQTLDPQARFRD